MAPKNPTKAPTAREDSLSDPTSQDASQDTAGQMAKTFNERAKKATATRRQENMAAIRSTHNDRVSKLRNDVNTCFEKHDNQVRGLRRPIVERLMALLVKKHELEDRIDKCQSELARSFEEAAQQLQAAVDGRVEDLNA